MSNSCSQTLLAFHSPKAVQHNFVLEFHTFPLEQHLLPIEVNPYLQCMKETSTEPPLVQRGHRTKGLTHLLDRQGKHV